MQQHLRALREQQMQQARGEEEADNALSDDNRLRVSVDASALR